MTARIGLGVGSDGIRAVLVRRGRILWSHQIPIEDQGDLRAVLDETLAQLPKRFGRRPRLVAAIGPSAAQLKSLSAFGAGGDRMLGDAVAANAARFFLCNGVPLRVTGVRRDAPDRAWVAAMEAPVIGAIEEACRNARIRYDGALPTLAVLAHAMYNSADTHTVHWQDDAVSGEVVIHNGRLQRVTRLALDDPSTDHPLLAAPLRALNGSGWALAAAYAVTRADLRDPLVLRPAADAVRQRRHHVVLRGFMSLLVVAAGLSAAVAPGSLSTRARAYSVETLTQLAPRQKEVAQAQRELTRLTAALQRVDDFAGDRSRYTELIAAMTEAMPPMTAVINLKADGSGGSLIALSPQGASVFAAVSQLPGVTGAKISAPLTREAIESTEFDRVSVSFGFTLSGTNRARLSQPVR